METWVIHHTNMTIHRCAANTEALPPHLDDIDFRGAEIFARIPAREQRHLAQAYSSYACCEECEAALLHPLKHRGAA